MKVNRDRLQAGGRVALAIFVLAVLSGCEKKEAPPAAPPPPVDVVVATAEQRDVPIYSEWVGTTDGYINAQIRARVRGYLQSQVYTEGSRVKANDLMFTIDPRPYRAALDQAKGELGRARALLTKTEQDVRRYTPLAAEGAISRQELDNAVQANLSARAAVDSASAAVEKAQLDLDWTEIRSPIDGVAGISVAQVGDLISDTTVLTTVSQLDPIKVSFPISEQEYLRLAGKVQLDPSQKQLGKPSLELILADGNIFPNRGTASVANRQVDVKTGTMTVVALFPNPDGLVRPGQFGKVRVAIETRSGAVLVPQLAVQEVQGTYQLAVVGADNKVAIRNVRVGERVDRQWVIEEGLKPGERVIIEGLQKVRDGSVVNPKTGAAA